MSLRRPALVFCAILLVWTNLEQYVRSAERNDVIMVRPYHPDADHVWNRLHQALFIRTDGSGHSYGADELDVLLWPSTTTHLIEPTSHARALAALSAFNQQEVGAIDQFSTIARAILQRDLWAAFDWASDLNANGTPKAIVARQALRGPLHQAIRKVALSQEQLRNLPNTYENTVREPEFPHTFDPLQPKKPFLPAKLLDSNGHWICVGEEGIAPADEYKKLVPVHVDHFSRSVFTILMHFPGGPTQGIGYLKQLGEFSSPLVVDARRLELNKSLPELPIGTEVILLRRAMLIDSTGRLTPTGLVESIQIRVFDRHPDPSVVPMRQSFVEFVLSPTALLAGKPGLRAVTSDEHGFTFLSLRSSIDPFEEQRDPSFQVQRPLIHRSCEACHHVSGIRGLNSYSRSFGGHEGHAPLLVPSAVSASEKVAIFWKQSRADWGVFLGMSERSKR